MIKEALEEYSSEDKNGVLLASIDPVIERSSFYWHCALLGETSTLSHRPTVVADGLYQCKPTEHQEAVDIHQSLDVQPLPI